MKRLFALLLSGLMVCSAVLLMAITLTACGEEEQPPAEAEPGAEVVIENTGDDITGGSTTGGPINLPPEEI